MTKPKFSTWLLHTLKGQFVGCNAFISDLKTWKEFIPLIQITDPKQLIEVWPLKTLLIFGTVSSDLGRRL